jgi:hypothetical protein
MDTRLSTGSSTTAVVITALIGLVVGYGIASLTQANKSGERMMQSENNEQAMMVAPSTETAAAELRALLRSLEVQHVALAANATRRGYDGAKDFSDAAKALDDNSVDIAKAVESVYGADAGKRFLDIWRSHISFFVDYTTGAKANDKAKMDKAVQNLSGYQDAIADFFSSANPNLLRATVHSLVGEHVTLLKAAVDAHASGNYAQSYTKEHQAHEQIGTISDALSNAIVKQFPDKFK